MTISISFRTLTQINFKFDFEDDQTISDVKTKIAERGDEFAIDLQKLIYNGKVLENYVKVSEIGFEQSKFVVVMIIKKKPVAPFAASATESVAQPAVESLPAVSQPAVVAPESSGLTAEQEASVEAVMDLGYDRESVIATLRAAFWDANRAVEYLLTGIPDNVVGEAPPVQAREENNRPTPGPARQLSNWEIEDLTTIVNLPDLDNIRDMLLQNPDSVDSIVDQLSEENPRMMETLYNNQDVFMDILGGVPNRLLPEGTIRERARPIEAPRNEIQASGEEAEAIRRIKAIVVNAPEALVVEAYYACDKNEAAAIDFILNVLDEL